MIRLHSTLIEPELLQDIQVFPNPSTSTKAMSAFTHAATAAVLDLRCRQPSATGRACHSCEFTNDVRSRAIEECLRFLAREGIRFEVSSTQRQPTRAQGHSSEEIRT